MNKKTAPLFVLLIFFLGTCFAQPLQPGFDAKEYATALFIAFGRYDSMMKLQPVPTPANYAMIYRSKVVGLDNRWNLWLRKDGKQAVISIRGTVASNTSWLANVYSAMVPATGSIKLNDSTDFKYRLANSPDAGVHIGWLISLGSMSQDIEQKIKEQYSHGVKEFLIVGHSQGGAIAFLLRSYLYYRTQEGALPPDIIYKTYCSAAPKPGNLYYAYDYDFITRNGWSFTVVNAADWVPETPISIQQLSDLNPLNPFIHIKKALQKQKYIIRLYAGLVYNKLNKATRKAERRYERYLGEKIEKQVKKVLPQLEVPTYTHTMNYTRAGTPVVLMPDAAYYQQFPNDPRNHPDVWVHHTFDAYYFLVQANYLKLQ